MSRALTVIEEVRLPERAEAQLLLEMLAYKRPAYSDTERQFIAKYIQPLGAQQDGFGNWILQVGESSVIWSSHTDTVHHKEGMQTVLYRYGVARVRRKDGECLGADCTTGVWIMCEMIRAGVPGLYVFHQAEEIGGRGSRWLAKYGAKYLEKYTYAIAFDRKGYDSIVTHQGGSRTASDRFAKSLAPMLPKAPGTGGYFRDDTGIFTDTANYEHLVPECSNISVGYMNAHSPREVQDIDFALMLRDAMVKFDESRLVCDRDPYEIPWVTEPKGECIGATEEIEVSDPPRDLVEFCERNPEIAADILAQYGMDVATLRKDYPWSR